MEQIDERAIQELEQMMFSEFPGFAEKYREDHGEDLLPEVREGHVNSTVWTCYILGKAKGLSVKGWEGLLGPWGRRLGLPGDPVPEAFYRVDAAWVDKSQGGWWEGRWRMEVLFQHENNPAETKGHFREFFDLCAPYKILLTWANPRLDQRGIISMAQEVTRFCEANGIHSTGTSVLVAGDWARTGPLLASAKGPDDSVFRTLFLHHGS